jgi:hypothetical protein
MLLLGNVDEDADDGNAAEERPKEAIWHTNLGLGVGGMRRYTAAAAARVGAVVCTKKKKLERID